MRRYRSNPSSDLLRIICFFVGVFCSVFVYNAIRSGKLDVGLHGGKYIVITRASDSGVFWGIVIFFALIALTTLISAIFAKDGPKP
jgi:hypothetical protein